MEHWTCRRTVELKGGRGEGTQTSAEVDREMLDVHADLQADRQTSMQTDRQVCRQMDGMDGLLVNLCQKQN